MGEVSVFGLEAELMKQRCVLSQSSGGWKGKLKAMERCNGMLGNEQHHVTWFRKDLWCEQHHPLHP